MKKHCKFRVAAAVAMVGFAGIFLSARAQVTQEWARRINFGTKVGNDDIEGLAVDAQGNVYVGGTANLAHGPNVFTVVKYSPTGDRVWIGQYPGPYHTGCIAADFALDAAGHPRFVYYDAGADANDPHWGAF